MDSFERKIQEYNSLQKSQTQSLTAQNELQEIIDVLLKAGVSEDELIEKAKYVRREGTSGNYKYIYEEPKNTQKKEKILSIGKNLDKSQDSDIQKAEQTEVQKKKIQKVMDEWKAGTLKDSHGNKVTSHEQAVAIALSEAGVSKSVIDDLMKAKALPIGTIKQRPNGNFIKTANGWKYHSALSKNTALQASVQNNKKKSKKPITAEGIKEELGKTMYVESLTDISRYSPLSGGKNIDVYPIQKPDASSYSISNSNTFIRFAVKDGQLYFSSARGHRLGDLGKYLNKPLRSTGVVGVSHLDSSMNPIKIKPSQIPTIVKLVKEGLAKEAKAQREFYRGWTNPD